MVSPPVLPRRLDLDVYLTLARIPIEHVFGSKTSVYVGCFTREYEQLLVRDFEMNLKYIATGTGTAMLSNRLSWFYDLKGPSITLDTACSSSLNACHLACASLRNKEANMVRRDAAQSESAHTDS